MDTTGATSTAARIAGERWPRNSFPPNTLRFHGPAREGRAEGIPRATETQPATLAAGPRVSPA